MAEVADEAQLVEAAKKDPQAFAASMSAILTASMPTPTTILAVRPRLRM